MSLLVAGGSFNGHRILLRGCGTIDSDDVDDCYDGFIGPGERTNDHPDRTARAVRSSWLRASSTIDTARKWYRDGQNTRRVRNLSNAGAMSARRLHTPVS